MTFVGIDTNILAYAAGLRRAPADTAKIQAARAVLSSFRDDVTAMASTQVWGELYALLTRSGMARSDTRAIIDDLRTGIATTSVSTDIFNSALQLADRHALQIWDAIILKSCQAAGCTLFLTEDLQDGFRVESMLIINPLGNVRHPKLEGVLRAVGG